MRLRLQRLKQRRNFRAALTGREIRSGFCFFGKGPAGSVKPANLASTIVLRVAVLAAPGALASQACPALPQQRAERGVIALAEQRAQGYLDDRALAYALLERQPPQALADVMRHVD